MGTLDESLSAPSSRGVQQRVAQGGPWWRRLVSWARGHRTRFFLLVLACATGVAGLAAFLLTRDHRDPRLLWRIACASRQEGEALLESEKSEEAEQACRQAIEASGALVARWPRSRAYRRESAAAFDLLARSLAAQYRSDEADEAYREAIAAWAKLVAEEPGSLEERCRMAQCADRAAILLREDGRWDEAEHDFERGLLLCQNVPNVLAGKPELERHRVRFLQRLAELAGAMGHPFAALDRHAEAVLIQRGIVNSASGRTEDVVVLFSLLLDRADALVDIHKPDEALRALAEARALSERLVKQDPAAASYQKLAAVVLHRLGNVLRLERAGLSEADHDLTLALELWEKLGSRSPTDADYLAGVAATCGSLAALNRDRTDLDRAEEFYCREQAYRSQLVELDPKSVTCRFALGRALHELADLKRARGAVHEALPLAQQAADQLERVYRQDVRDVEHRSAISSACWELCAIEIDCGDHRAAAATVGRYLGIEASGYEESLEAARFLCRCAQLCRADLALAPGERDTLERSYLDQALHALRTAVRSGFLDLKDLNTSATYAPLHDRSDFKDLIREVESRLEQFSRD
jgi:tetratricopeptide (TPR) repeat protein